ncbi:hypothetical protein EST38_g8806 [Candolleomyces aberdarensis]|uniref:Laccase n=1 Tax=Candolleomyces aberdarensis TaxID=2316362 RepID=A0A4Q2DBQ7_9AGAR|nr:hypothetical protein EST38_g8806 [Candolleomyces aberdarensis]
MLLLASVLSQFAALALGAIGPVATVHIANQNISPDGFARSAVLAGATPSTLSFPGPVIIGNKGSTFLLNVVDALTDATMLRTTSIHWHGFFQAGSAWADGPAGVTQCPIAPGHSFLYKFQAKNQAGTFWYHSHHLSQYCDGLRGAMVVYDPADPHRSLYHVPAPSAGLVPTPDATLINGKGRYAGGPTSPLAVITVTRNRRYRFRLVSISCDPHYVFSIDGHTMTIIEVDGENVQPLNVDSIEIFAGQRYSFVLNTNRPVANYWVRANPNVGTTGFAGGINSAILRYVGAPNADPVSTQTPNSSPLLETNLHPLTSPAAPGLPTATGVDVNINLDIVFDFASLTFKVNGATFDHPSVPVLLQILSGTPPTSLLPAGSIYALPANKVVQISMPGGSTGSPHPIHLHGHAFSVVRSAGSSTYNYANPVRRDVVSIGTAGDNVTIRFRTDNAGPWIMHCHIDWHLVLGLSVVFAEDVPTIATSDPPREHPSKAYALTFCSSLLATFTAAWDQLCPIYDALPPGT